LTEAEVRDRIHAVPKTELHVHLDGSVRPETLVELGAQYGVALPTADVGELADYLFVRDAGNLEDYLARFAVTLSVMQNSAALERIAYDLCEDAAAENNRYMEIRYSPILHTREGLPLPAVVDAALRGMQRAQDELGIRSNLIICGIRNMDPVVSRDLADLTIAYKDRGAVAFDLAGAEYNYPAKKHKNAFYMVRNANIGATIHAGEAYGPESIHQAIHYCGAQRIGHGTRLYEDPDLMTYVNDFRIPLEICLTSNVDTGAVKDVESHPFGLLFRYNFRVTLNTDDRLMSATTLTKEFAVAQKAFKLDLDDLEKITINAMKSAFIPYKRRLPLIFDFIKPGYARARAEFGGTGSRRNAGVAARPASRNAKIGPRRSPQAKSRRA
jgi:adenosine deaminase